MGWPRKAENKPPQNKQKKKLELKVKHLNATQCLYCSIPRQAARLRWIVFSFLFLVVRAKVLLRNHTEEGEKHAIRVYDLKILKIYKGGDLLVSNQKDAVNGVQFNSSGQIKLLIKAYADAVKLTKGTEYLLTGKPTNGSILINAGSWVEPWSAVTPAHQAGISGIYAQNCECQITPCFGKPCKPPLKGCDIPARKFREFYKSCKWRHFYCLKNEEGSACSWHETAEYMDCLGELP